MGKTVFYRMGGMGGIPSVFYRMAMDDAVEQVEEMFDENGHGTATISIKLDTDGQYTIRVDPPEGG